MIKMTNVHKYKHDLAVLLEKIALRDQYALKQLSDQLLPHLTRQANKLLEDRDLCHDAVQETLLQIWHNASKYQRELGQPITWINSLLRYRALDILRYEQREQKRRNQFMEAQPLLSEAHDDSPINKLLQAESSSNLNGLINTLDPVNKNTLVMTYFYNYRQQETAIHLNQPIDTVKSRLRRSLSKLKVQLAA